MYNHKTVRILVLCVFKFMDCTSSDDPKPVNLAYPHPDLEPTFSWYFSPGLLLMYVEVAANNTTVHIRYDLIT